MLAGMREFFSAMTMDSDLNKFSEPCQGSLTEDTN